MKILMNILQLVGGIILSIGYIPQIRQVLKTKEVKDFNKTYLTAIVVGVGCMEVYATYSLIQGVAIMFFATNTVAFVLAIAMLVLYLLYSKIE